MMTFVKTRWPLPLLGVTLATFSPAQAQVENFQWSVVGAPGNRPTRSEEVPWQPGLRVGSVPYEFRITRTEVTVADYIGFVRGYAPYWSGAPFDPSFTGTWIFWNRIVGTISKYAFASSSFSIRLSSPVPTLGAGMVFGVSTFLFIPRRIR